MNKNHIIIIILVCVIIALIALISLPFIINNQNDEIIYNNIIDGIGTFNTTNVTNFTVDDSYGDGVTHYVDNDTISQVVTYGNNHRIENTRENADRVNDSVDGHSIYKFTANRGEHKGEVRYGSFLEDYDNDHYILISSPDYNLTCMMVDSFKIF